MVARLTGSLVVVLFILDSRLLGICTTGTTKLLASASEWLSVMFIQMREILNCHNFHNKEFIICTVYEFI